jgi:uncharacterized glyoxalase superfamily protein PhnB
MAVKPIPDAYHSVTPYLVVPDVDALIRFLKEAFDAVELSRHAAPNGRVMHAEVRIGDSIVMMGEANEQYPATQCGLLLYVAEVDDTYRKALGAGARSQSPPADQFYGDRSGGVFDPAGNTWWIATHKEDVSREEMERRMTAATR